MDGPETLKPGDEVHEADLGECSRLWSRVHRVTRSRIYVKFLFCRDRYALSAYRRRDGQRVLICPGGYGYAPIREQSIGRLILPRKGATS